jgi:hypothetical protein
MRGSGPDGFRGFAGPSQVSPAQIVRAPRPHAARPKPVRPRATTRPELRRSRGEPGDLVQLGRNVQFELLSIEIRDFFSPIAALDAT